MGHRTLYRWQGSKAEFYIRKGPGSHCIKSLDTSDQRTYNLSDGNFYSRYELGNIAKNVLNLKTVKFHLPVNFVKFIAFISEKCRFFEQQSGSA